MKLHELNLLSVGNTIQLVGAVYQGEGKTLLCFFPEEKDDLPHEVLEMGQTDWRHFIAQTDKLETEVLQRGPDGAIVKAIVRKCQRSIEQSVVWSVYRRDGFTCRYCAADDVPMTVDHLVCWEEGGPSTEENMVSSCRKCNKVRGNTSYERWLQHPHYLAVSRGLSQAVRDLNESLVASLASVPRLSHVRSR